MAKFLKLLIIIPLAVLILAFAIANRQMVSVSFDPFSNPETTAGFVTAPLCMLLLFTLITGVIVGGVATWFTQGRNRRKARVAQDEAEQWRDEAMRLRRQPPLVTASDNRALVRSDI